MIIVLKPNPTPELVQRVVDRIEQLGYVPHLSQGVARTIVGIIGDVAPHQAEFFLAIDGVESVLPILKPYKLVGREAHPADTIIEVQGVRIGGGHLAMIAGPCLVESAERLNEIAERVREAGANILRGSAFPAQAGSSPTAGLGEAGWRILEEAGQRFRMPTISEVADPRQVEWVGAHVDILQIGERNMQNFDLLKEVGQARTPVLLERGMAATVESWLMSAEVILAQGNRQVILCERGVRSFEDSTRCLLDLSAVPTVQRLSHLPIVVDPSHASGRPDLIPPLARAALAAGADGIHVEVHTCPEVALSDGRHALSPAVYAGLLEELRQLAGLLGKTIDAG